MYGKAGRTILHADLDAFFAAVEQRDRQELRGRPVLVGGSRERGVVCACSYEARRFGIHSAMSMAEALRRCPEAVVMPVRKKRYQQLSAQVFAIMARFTDRLEPLSIDEAFLDITGCERLFGPPRCIAERIRREVRAETGLTVSVGIAPNKFLAKLASDHGKPDGLVEVLPEDIDAFLLPLPLTKIYGVGPMTARQLAAQGLRTVMDLHRLSRADLAAMFGSSGDTLFRLARGIDDRPVQTQAAIKSVGHEETFAIDLCEVDDLRRELLGLAERVASRLRRYGLSGRCVTLKVKYADFTQTTRSKTQESGMNNAMQIYREALALLERTQAASRPVRLLGISVSHLKDDEHRQPNLFAEADRRSLSALDQAVDGIRQRYGVSGVCRASLLGRTAPSGKK